MNILGTSILRMLYLDRLITINLDYCDKETEIEILQQKTQLNHQEALESSETCFKLKILWERILSEYYELHL